MARKTCLTTARRWRRRLKAQTAEITSKLPRTQLSTHPDASNAISSRNVAQVRDQKPATLENAGQDRSGCEEGDARRESMSLDVVFHEGGKENEGVETSGSWMPRDKEIVSMEQIDGQAIKSNLLEVYKPPAHPPKGEEALRPFRTNARLPRPARTFNQGRRAIQGAPIVPNLPQSTSTHQTRHTNADT